MRPLVCLLALSFTALSAAPALASDACEECPNVELSKDGEQRLRVAASDDSDPAESLRHRLRLRTGTSASAWSDWSAATDYEIAPGARGVIEAQTVDSEGFVGIGSLEWIGPDVEPIGPGERRETSQTDAQWSEDAIEPGQAMTEDIAAPVRPNYDQSSLEDFHSADCPVTTSDDATCSAVAPARRSSPGWVLAVGLLGLLWARRR